MIPFSFSGNREIDNKVRFDQRLYGGWSPSQLQASHQQVMPSGASSGFGFQCSPSIPRTYSYEKKQSEIRFMHNRTLDFHQLSPRYSFVPLSNTSSSGFDKDKCAATSLKYISSTTCIDSVKLSPTPSTRTLDTLESFESFRGSVHDGEEYNSGSPLSYMYTKDPHSHLGRRNYELSYSPNALANEYCQFIDSDGSFYPEMDYSQKLFSKNPQRNKSISLRTNEQDQNRKSRLKTELCIHYRNNTLCPYGKDCTYAHGEDELQFKTLVDLHDAGLADVSTYRTVPCLTFVCTGSW